MFDMQDHEGCRGDPADGPGAKADVAQGRGLEQGVPTFADGADRVVGSVELLLDQGASAVLVGNRLAQHRHFGFLNATVMVACSPS